jgi:AcrR family transcriptional regulator
MVGVFADRAKGCGKRVRTRAALMDAATDAFGQHGIEAASVNAIAHAADVSNGTFYNHFRDKDEIVGAVAFGIARELAQRIDDAISDESDAADRVSFGTRQCIELATRHPSWGRAWVRSVWSLPELRREVSSFARADLERGVRDGVFKLEVDDLFVDVFTSMVVTAVELCLEGQAGPDAGPRVAEHQLRMLGVSQARARRIAWRPLEPLEIP